MSRIARSVCDNSSRVRSGSSTLDIVRATKQARNPLLRSCPYEP
jgi:hypothetical protein